MRRALVWVVTVAGGILAVTAANFRRDAGPTEVDWQLFRPAPPLITIGSPSRGPIARTVAAKGVVEPIHQIQVVAKVVGKVAEVCVVEGATVSPGDILVKLDPAMYRTRADATKARLDTATRTLDVAEVHLREVEKEPAAATSPATPAAAAPALAGFPGVPVVAPPSVGPTRLEAARKNVDGWKQERKAAEAADQAARTDLDRVTIRAPLAGVVEELTVEVADDVGVGSAVRMTPGPGPTAMPPMGGLAVPPDLNPTAGEPVAVGPVRAICTIMDPKQLRVRAWVDEGDVGLVAADQRAQVFLPDEPARPVAGRIARVAARGKPAGEVVAYPASVELIGGGARARAGMRVNVEIEVSRAEGLLGVPVQAVVHRRRRDLALALTEPPLPGVGFRAVPIAPGEVAEDSEYVKAVFVVEGDRVRLRPIETGLSDERRVEVVTGLTGDDRLVVGPFRSLDSLEDQMPVRVGPPGDAGAPSIRTAR